MPPARPAGKLLRRAGLAAAIGACGAGCTFRVDGLDPFSDGGAADGAPPDLVASGGSDGGALLALDVRSPAYFQFAAQPYLAVRPETVAHYKFDEPSGAALDDVATAHLQPGPAFSGVRAVFTPLALPGSNTFSRTAVELRGDGFSAASPAALDPGAGDFTVEAWFRIPPGYTATVGGSGCDPLFSKGAPGGRSFRGCVQTGGKLGMVVSNGPVTKSLDSGGATFADGAWHLGTFVFGVTQAGAGALYVDGRDLAAMPSDLSIVGGLSTMSPFTVGGSGPSELRAGLAELAFHRTLLALADHQASYRAFLPPPLSPAAAPGDLTYRHDGVLCPIVGDDPTRGDQVACYGPGQFAVARAAPADPSQNPGRLGMLLAPSGANFAQGSEAFEQWMTNGAVQADAALSPRGDRTADTIALGPSVGAGGGFALVATALAGNGPATFSVWLRGQKDGDLVFVRVTDFVGKELAHCLETLSARWRRYACTATFTRSPTSVKAILDTYVQLPGDNHPPLPAVTFDAWGAQLEAGGTPSVYVPNPGPMPSKQVRAPVLLLLGNSSGRYLAGAAGRVALSFTGDGSLGGGAYLFDAAGTMAAPAIDRHYLVRKDDRALEAGVLDGAGMLGTGAVLTSAPLDWAGTHTLGLAWSATPPFGAGAHSLLTVDGTDFPGRADPYPAGTPPALAIGGGVDGSGGPGGALHTLVIESTAE